MTRNRKDDKKGKLVELLVPSPVEEAPTCPTFSGKFRRKGGMIFGEKFKIENR